ncbi:flagellin [Luteibacter sp. OK325]|uniref:flagellin N-terminal helical domain-containing protein n=1 Tax=Luteibacter sp. OK325 TaxID=2135670 RepID=UPI000D36D7C5|nr:flagellin [Luteibacter sp. OK325]PTR28460.1 flagellin [Luteibacter sp. OK325]
MALTINTNIMSLNAQRNLGTSQTKLASAIERLSSGNRINSAKDDAAGLAISTRMTTQINGLNRAVQNANDGISLSQTTESALDEVTNNMQRIRELAVQSTNASNSPSDRAALDAEVQQRLAEVTRIATQTNFNGMKVLDGSAQNLSFQVGANVGEVINVGLNTGMKANQVGQLATTSVAATFPTAAAGLTLGAGQLTIGGTDVTGNFTDAAGLAAAINTVSTGLATVVGGEVKLTNTTGAAIVVGGSSAAGLGLAGSIAATTGTATSTGVATAVAAPAGTATTPVTIASGALSIQVGSGTAFNISGTFKSTQDLADAINSKSSEGITAYVSATDGSLKLSSAQDITITATGAAATLGFATGTTAVSATSTLADASVSTVDGANDTINRIDAALQSVSSLRSTLGAVQNRFESTISNLQNISQNLTSSKSAITDADFAQETANMSSAQILQQAGVSVLAQANQSQQIVTKLLQ